jgi:hypothetical protein
VLIAAAFFGLWLIPGAPTTVAPFLILFGAAYFSEFWPNTTTFVYPAEIFPVRVRTTSHTASPPRARTSFSAVMCQRRCSARRAAGTARPHH